MDPLIPILIFSAFALGAMAYIAHKALVTLNKHAELIKASTITEVVQVEERRELAKAKPPKQALVEQDNKSPTVKMADGREIPMSELEVY